MKSSKRGVRTKGKEIDLANDANIGSSVCECIYRFHEKFTYRNNIIYIILNIVIVTSYTRS